MYPVNTEKIRLSSENARLRRANEELRNSKRELERKYQTEIKALKKELEQEKEKNEELEKRANELERQRDKYRDMIFKPNRCKEDVDVIESESEFEEAEKTGGQEKFVWNNNSLGRKKRGGQKGHKGYSRPKAEQIEEEDTKRVYLEKCPECETQLKRSQTIKSHIVEDIPELEESRVKAVRYNTEVQWCPKCKKFVKGRAIGVIPRCRLGVNVFLYVLVHKYICRATWETIVFNLFNWYGLKVSKGSLVGMMHRARKWMGWKYDDLLEKIRSSNVKYADETSWRVGGINHWLWGFFTDRYAYYTIEESRGKGIPKNVLKGSHPEDVLIRDDYGGYKKLPFHHQSCWAHLLRESHERASRPNSSDEIRQLHQKLKTIFRFLQKIVQQPFQPEIRNRAYKLFKIDIQHIIDTNYIHDDAKEIQTRISNQKSNLITALLHENVPLTNNHSERNIRPLVVTRKISGGSRSKDGAKTHAVHMSIMQSIRLQNLSLLPTLKKYLLHIDFPNSE